MEEDSVPLSNAEVLIVLKAKNQKTKLDIVEYLESITNPDIFTDKYPLEKLRDLKKNENIDESIFNLTIFSNTHDPRVISKSSLKIINNFFN
jgi:hypothetical protein